MSNLAGLLVATKVEGSRFIDSPPLKYTKVTHEAEAGSYRPEYGFRMNMGVAFNASYNVLEEHGQREQDHIANKVRRMILEEVFGEFREPMNELRMAIYSRDIEEIIQKFDKLEQQLLGDL